MRGHGRGYGRVLLGGDVEMGMGMVCWALGGRGCAYGRGVGAGVGVGMASVVGRGHGREYGVDGYAGVDVNVDNTSRKRISHSSQRLTFVAPCGGFLSVPQPCRPSERQFELEIFACKCSKNLTDEYSKDQRRGGLGRLKPI